MKRKITFMFIVALFMLSMGSITQIVGYSSEIQTGSIIQWQLDAVPSEPFNMYYTGGGYWLAENDTVLSLSIDSFEDDLIGVLKLGNITVLANDTEIAKDLTLGVWGTYAEWWPGLVIEVGQSNIDSLNATAYASAERLDGNYLNGTMTSRYETITAGGVQHQCIVFNFEQDSPGTQVTHLAYSLVTGVLIEANTSYSFGEPYELAFRFQRIVETTTVDFSVDNSGAIIFAGVVGGALFALIVLVYIILSKRN
jgi:hypothetical protein